MDLREAAASAEPAAEPPRPRPPPRPDFWGRAAARGWNGHGFEAPTGFEERWGQAKDRDGRYRKPEDEKRRWSAAFEAARRRGLDEDEAPPPPKQRSASQRPKSNRRMNPHDHARALIRETSMPLTEVAHITRLSVYQVAAIKLKMRAEPVRGRHARAGWR